MLSLIVLGGARVERDGQLVGGAASQRRVLALLSVVALARERGVSRDRLLGLLWPDAEPDKARQALTQALYHARRALDADSLFITAAELRLNPDVITSDVVDFEAALDRGELERAVHTYHGPLLDGFYVSGAPEFERWVAAERARLASRCAAALEQLADARARAGDSVDAVAWLSRLAAIDPLNARVAAKLMAAMVTAGDRAGAVRQGRIHQSLVREELGVSADPEVTSLLARLCAVAPAVAAEDSTASTASTASSEPAPPAAAAPDAAARRGSLRHWLEFGRWQRALAIGGVIVGIAASTIMVRSARRSPAPPPSGLVVITPFRVAGADPALAFLREGMVDLLFTKLTDADAGRAADPGTVMAAWRRAGLAERPDVSHADLQRVARQLRGTRVLLGSVVGTPERLVLSASLLGVRDGTLYAQASVEGSGDSLTVLTDRLVARMLAAEAGVNAELAGSMSASAPAVRAYLDGQAAYRRGAYQEAIRAFYRALDQDPAFAMAGLGLAHAAERINARDARAHGVAAAWAARAELTPRDSIYLAALAGPRYPSPSSERELLLAWERAASVLSDRADVWHELGERLFFDGRWLAVSGWQARAAVAFRRAAELDPSFSSPRRYLAQVAADRGDTSETRRAVTAYLQVDSAGDLATFVRWRFASFVGDSSQLRSIRRSLSSASPASLRAILLSSQYDGTAVQDAEPALAELRRRAARSEERAELLLAEHALAVNGGDRSRADAVIEELDAVDPLSPVADRLRVLDALFGGGNAVDASAATQRLATRRPGAATRSPSESGIESLDDACVLTMWAVGRGAGSVADWGGREPVSRDASATSTSPACTFLAEAAVAVGTGRVDALAAVVRADSVLTFGPPAAFLRHYSGIALARLYAELGDRQRALSAIRRRPHMQEWPHYLASQLREEGRLAASLRDTTGAVRAFRHYLALRVSPDDRVRREVETVREELQRLEATRHDTR